MPRPLNRLLSSALFWLALGYGFLFLDLRLPWIPLPRAPKTVEFSTSGPLLGLEGEALSNLCLTAAFALFQSSFFVAPLRRRLGGHVGGDLHACWFALGSACLYLLWDSASAAPSFWSLHAVLGGSLSWLVAAVQIFAGFLLVKSAWQLRSLASRRPSEDLPGTARGDRSESSALRAAMVHARSQEAASLGFLGGLNLLLFASAEMSSGRLVLAVAAFLTTCLVLRPGLFLLFDLREEVAEAAKIALLRARVAPSVNPLPAASTAQLPPPPRAGSCPRELLRGVSRLQWLWLGLPLGFAGVSAHLLQTTSGFTLSRLPELLTRAPSSERELKTFALLVGVVVGGLWLALALWRWCSRLRQARAIYREGVLVPGEITGLRTITTKRGRALDYILEVTYLDLGGSPRQAQFRGVGRPSGRVSLLLAPGRERRPLLYIPADPVTGSLVDLYDLGKSRALAA